MIVADFDNGDDLFGYLRQNPVDIILMDIHLPASNGLDLAERVKESFPDVKVIMHTMSEDNLNKEKAKVIGAEGYVLKNYGQKELEKALEMVSEGSSYYSI